MPKTPACSINVAYADAKPEGLPISVGVPFRQGMLNPGAALAVTAPDGEKRPAAIRPLAGWPDGSVRWGLVSFGARVTGAHAVAVAAPAAAAPRGVTLKRAKGAWTVDTGSLKFTVNESGPGIFSRIACEGHAYLSDPAQLRFCVDGASTRHEAQRTVRVIEQSALRVRLRVEGGHYLPHGARRLTYRLDIEAWAGWTALRLDYHYFHCEPGRPAETISRIALDADWNLKGAPARHFLQRNYGLFYISRHVFNPEPVAIAADFVRSDPHVEDPAMLRDDVDYPFYLHAPLVSTHNWLGVGDAHRAVYLQMQDFTEAKPNRMVSAGNRLSLEVWPATAAPLELPQGRSRRQTLTLAFIKREPETGRAQTEKLSNAPHQAPQGVAAVLGALVYEDRACVAPAWFARCGEFDQASVLPAGRHIRIENNLAGLMRLDMPETKFDIGDTDSHYNSSYAWLDGKLVPPLAGAPALPRIWPKMHPTQTYLDCREPVWTNNEYDVIHAFGNELMRTGRPELWRTLRLTARHNLEVDFLHYSDHRWLHRATPAHSARHTTTGAYPSHFWTQGLLEYYCLTGDIDALEVAIALGDKTIENFSDPELRKALWGFNREIGWTILALVHLYDITREARFKALADELVAYVVGFDRDGFQGAVNLSAGNDRQSLNRQLVGNFFGYASMVEGVDRYAAVTGRKDVDAWLRKLTHDLADAALEAAREGAMPGINFSMALAVGYERTGDKRFLDMTGLLLEQVYWNATGLHGGGSVKPVAAAYRGFTRLLGHAWKHGLLEPYEFPSARALNAAPAQRPARKNRR